MSSSPHAFSSRVVHLLFGEEGEEGLYSSNSQVMLLCSALPLKVHRRPSCCFQHCFTEVTVLQSEIAFFLTWRGTVPGETMLEIVLELEVPVERYILTSTNPKGFVDFPIRKPRNYSNFLLLIRGRAKRVTLLIFSFPKQTNLFMLSFSIHEDGRWYSELMLWLSSFNSLCFMKINP